MQGTVNMCLRLGYTPEQAALKRTSTTRGGDNEKN